MWRIQISFQCADCETWNLGTIMESDFPKPMLNDLLEQYSRPISERGYNANTICSRCGAIHRTDLSDHSETVCPDCGEEPGVCECKENKSNER